MLIYLASPYTNVDGTVWQTKDNYMKALMSACGNYMASNPGHHIVTPLFCHYIVVNHNDIGGDWNTWKRYSIDLLRRSDVVFWVDLGDNVSSVGMRAEIELAHSLNLKTERFTLEERGYPPRWELIEYWIPENI